MRQNYFFEYVPNAYLNLCVDKAQQMANNRFIYDFKAGKPAATRFCAELLISYLTRQYSTILKDFVVVFCPDKCTMEVQQAIRLSRCPFECSRHRNRK